MAGPKLWIIAGPNGAGKTTFVQRTRHQIGLPQSAFINPDAITLEYLQAKGIHSWAEAPPEVLKQTFIQAANDAQAVLEERMESGGMAVIETVLSTEKYCQLVDRVIELGGSFHLVYVALESPALSKERVAQRVSKGGHGVPADKLESRWHKSLELLPWFAVRATEFWLFDNSSFNPLSGEVLLASGRENILHLHGLPPQTARPIVAEFVSRFSKLDKANRWSFDLGDGYLLD